MIKAIIFDLGYVVLNQEGLTQRLNEIFGMVPHDKLKQALNHHTIPLCRNEISELESWHRVTKELGIEIPDEQLKDIWHKDYENLCVVDEDVAALLVELKKKCKLGLLTNTMPYHSKVNRARGVYDPFDVVVESCAENMSKDNPALFKIMTDRLGVNPEECVFIDDHKDFVDIANGLGMGGIVFTDADQLRKELEKKEIL